MPYPAQVNRESIVAQARILIEQEGVEQVSLATLAASLGIKAPSLYRYFNSKNALIQAVNTLTMTELIVAIQASIADPDENGNDISQWQYMAQAYRGFAMQHPITYALALNSASPETQVDAALAEQMVLPLQALITQIAGEQESLAALRGMLALLHGFVSLELTGNFRRGGDLSEMFVQCVNAYIVGWQR